MADITDLVDRADLLMRRRRSFVAAQPVRTEPIAEIPTLTTPASTLEDDLPVLTEVVSAEASVSEKRAERLDETQVALMASEIAHAIEQQLAVELPTLIEAVLLNAGEELRSGINSTMETALRDFLARRKQLRLPLDETDTG
jgi:uncharacterized protein (DUF2267 family)